MQCPVCGYTLEKKAKKCPRCGSTLKLSDILSENAFTGRQRSRRISPWVFAAVGILAVLGLLVGFWPQPQSPAPEASTAASSGSTLGSTGTTVPSTALTIPSTKVTVPSTAVTAPSTNAPTQPTASEPWSSEYSVLRFLTEVNHSGAVNPGTGPLPPGASPDPGGLPEADTSMVGQTVPIVLSTQQPSIPLVFLCQPEAQTVRLALLIPAKIPLLMILEPKLGSLETLCGCIATQSVFYARILSMTNVNYMDYLLADSRFSSTAQIPSQYLIDPDFTPVYLKYQTAYGTIGVSDYGTVRSTVVLVTPEPRPDAVSSCLDLFVSLCKTFGLEEFFPL